MEEILNEYFTGFCIAGYRGTYYGIFTLKDSCNLTDKAAESEALLVSKDELEVRITTLLSQYLNLNVSARMDSGGSGVAGVLSAYQRALAGFDRAETDSDSSWLISKALGYINAHFQEDICLEDVAQHVGLSESYLSKILKQGTGKSYSKLLIQARIERAKYLLGSTEEKVYTISRQIGYTNPYYFDRIFKAVVGRCV